MVVLLTLALALALAGCAGPPAAAPPGSAPPVGPPASSPGTPTGTAGPGAGAGAVAWSRPLDGAVYAAPLVVGDPAAGGVVVAATENDSLYGLDPSTGRVRWRTRVGRPVPLSALPCGNIDPLGITGSPAYDPVTGSVFAVAETTGPRHLLVALDPRTGKVRWRRGVDVPGRDPAAMQQRGALAVANGRVYVAYGGLFGDCGDYVGTVVAVPTDGRGPPVSWSVPTAQEGGIWAPSGPAVAADGSLYVAVGNGAATGGRYDGSDSVTRLSADLRRLGFFAPREWARENAADLDLGSMGPLLLPGGRVVADGKGGTAYLLDATRLGGIGGALAALDGCAAYGWPAATRRSAFLPCEDGVRRLETAGDRLRWAWQARGIPGSPLPDGGRVWALDPPAGMLYALDVATGRVRLRVDVGEATRFARPVRAGDRLLVPTLRGVVSVTR